MAWSHPDRFCWTFFKLHWTIGFGSEDQEEILLALNQPMLYTKPYTVYLTLELHLSYCLWLNKSSLVCRNVECGWSPANVRKRRRRLRDRNFTVFSLHLNELRASDRYDDLWTSNNSLEDIHIDEHTSSSMGMIHRLNACTYRFNLLCWSTLWHVARKFGSTAW